MTDIGVGRAGTREAKGTHSAQEIASAARAAAAARAASGVRANVSTAVNVAAATVSVSCCNPTTQPARSPGADAASSCRASPVASDRTCSTS